jgi:hypothetical protein
VTSYGPWPSKTTAYRPQSPPTASFHYALVLSVTDAPRHSPFANREHPRTLFTPKKQSVSILELYIPVGCDTIVPQFETHTGEKMNRFDIEDGQLNGDRVYYIYDYLKAEFLKKPYTNFNIADEVCDSLNEFNRTELAK